MEICPACHVTISDEEYLCKSCMELINDPSDQECNCDMCNTTTTVGALTHHEGLGTVCENCNSRIIDY